MSTTLRRGRSDARANRVGTPLVSACLIVRDEEHQLAACLESARSVADEIVVYDTGSADGTVKLARTLGAEVTEGYWDDDFARARNEALAHCKGRWILWLDADEQLACDRPSLLRAKLAGAPSNVEGYLLLIDNLQGTGAATTFTHPAVRLFRRRSCRWQGSLHEQVVRRDGSIPSLVLLQGARITHHGYLDTALRDREKVTRNIRSAFQDLSLRPGADRASALLSLGRSYGLASSHEASIDLCRRVLELRPTPSVARLALRTLGYAFLATDRPEEAIEAADELRRRTRVPALADLLEGQARLALGEPEAALRSLERLEAVVDDDGFEYRPSMAANWRARAHLQLNRPAAAADVLLDTLRALGGLDVHLGLLVEALERARRGAGEIFDAIPPDRLHVFVPQVLQLEAPTADRVLDAWRDRDPASLPVLAAAAQVAQRLDVARQLYWSWHLRARGLSGACPLLAMAAPVAATARRRALQSAVAWTSFADPRALQAFTASALDADQPDRDELRGELAALAPGLITRLDALPAAAPPARSSLGDGPTASVLVVTPSASALGPTAVAGAVARLGHDVTLLCPGPPAISDTLQSRLGVRVVGWPEPSGPSWHEPCASAVAALVAERPVDAVVLWGGASELAPRVRALAPAAHLVDDRMAAGTTGPYLVNLLGDLAAVPADIRSGVVAVACLRDATTREVQAVCQALAQLSSGAEGLPVVHYGDDPQRAVTTGVPSVTTLGPGADPSPWVRAARAVVILRSPDEDQWRQLAHQAGTPCVLAQDDLDDPELLAKLLATLLERGHQVPEVRDLEATTPGAFDAGALTARVLNGARCVDLESRRLHVVGGHDVERHGLAGLLDDVRGDLTIERHAGDVDLLDIGPGPIVMIPHLERAALPAESIGALRDRADEVWTFSPWARARSVASGIPEGRVHAVSPLVHPAFAPQGPRRDLHGARATKVLFTGPASEEAGLDVLLEAWTATFDAADDACLVIAVPTGSPASPLARFVGRLADEAAGSLELVELPSDPVETAALVRACDVLAHPRRVDGSGHRVAEAMACGLPAIIAGGTASDLYCDRQSGWVIGGREVHAPRAGWTPTSVGLPWIEPSRAELADALRSAVADSGGRRARATEACRRSLQRPRRDEVARTLADRLGVLFPSSAATSSKERP